MVEERRKLGEHGCRALLPSWPCTATYRQAQAAAGREELGERGPAAGLAGGTARVAHG